MLPKQKRLVRADFFRKPSGSRSCAFGSVRFLAGAPGAAVVISKKVAPKAVARNKMRRRLYAIVRPLLGRGRATGAIIIYPNKAAFSAPVSELRAALAAMLA